MLGRVNPLTIVVVLILGINAWYFLGRKSEENSLKDFLHMTGRVEYVSPEIIGNKPRWNYCEIKYSYQVNERTFQGNCQIGSDIRILPGWSIPIRVAKTKPSLSTCDSEETKAALAERAVQSFVKSAAFNPSSKETIRLLFDAIFHDHTRSVDILLRSGVSPDSTYGVEGPAIVYAARLGRLEITVSLIKSGADVNTEDARGMSAIKSACDPEKVAIFNRLKDAGAKGGC